MPTCYASHRSISRRSAEPSQGCPHQHHLARRHVTPLAYDEFNANGEGYQAMIDASAAQRTGTSDEIAEAAAFLLGEHVRFVTGTDLLIDGGVIASIRTGMFKLQG